MSWFDVFVGGSIKEPVEAIGGVLDELFTSDEEELNAKIIMERLRQKPALAQAALNKVEASHRSIFVAGWRPFIGWVCGVGLTYAFLINPCIQWATDKPGPVLPIDIMMELVIAMLGLATLRTVEKLKGKAK